MDPEHWLQKCFYALLQVVKFSSIVIKISVQWIQSRKPGSEMKGQGAVQCTAGSSQIFPMRLLLPLSCRRVSSRVRPRPRGPDRQRCRWSAGPAATGQSGCPAWRPPLSSVCTAHLSQGLVFLAERIRDTGNSSTPYCICSEGQLRVKQF